MRVIFENSSSVEWRARFHEVVPPHLGEARALARSLTGSGPDSEDVVQEACLRAFRGISGFGGTNARAWILTIVRHAAYDWIRKRRVEPELVDDLTNLIDHVGCDASPTPESQLASYQEVQELEQAIQALPALFRKTLVLRYGEGMTYKEIAAVTGVPTGTVMSRLSRARRLVCESIDRAPLWATG